jgi:hypothetical protein
MACTDKFQIIRDSREKQGWTFATSASCSGTDVRRLETGDYTIVGWESAFVVERKASITEYAGNLFEPRFERELVRLDSFAHPYLFLEFEYDDLMRYPQSTDIPRYKWKYLRVTPHLLLKRHHELRLRHPTLRVEFVGKHGKQVALSLFKRIVENVPRP